MYLLFHCYVILPNKVKRTHKIRGRNTLKCPGLTGLQQGEYRRMQKEQLWLTESGVLDTLTRK